MIPQNKDGKRIKWSSARNYMLAIFCWASGVGNCYRFIAIKPNTGMGVFVIQYVLVMAILGIPLAYMELGLGQFSSRGSLTIWQMCPLMRGFGVGQMLLNLYIQVFYHVINAHLLFYATITMVESLPWAKCEDNDMERQKGKDACYTLKDNDTIRAQCYNNYDKEFCDSLNWVDSAHFYWSHNVLNKISMDMATASMGDLRPKTLVSSFFVALFVYFINCKGLKSVEKVLMLAMVYQTIIICVILFVSFLDPGASSGLGLLFSMDMKGLSDVQSWNVAAQQVIFAMSIGLGGYVNTASIGNFRSSVHLMAIIFGLAQICLPIAYSIIAYNCYGIIAYNLNIHPENIIKMENTVLFGKILNNMLFLRGPSRVWTFLFHSSLFVCGLRNEALNIFNHWISISDVFPVAKRYLKTTMASIAMSIFLMAIPICTQTGVNLLIFIDRVMGGSEILLLLAVETTSIVVIYGVYRFVDDLHFMLGFRASLYYQLCWCISPPVLLILAVQNIIKTVNELRHHLAIWLCVLCIIKFTLPYFIIMVYMIITIRQCVKNKQAWYRAVKPSEEWGPTDKLLKKSRDMFSSHSMTKEYMYRQNKLKTRYTEKLSVIGEQVEE